MIKIYGKNCINEAIRGNTDSLRKVFIEESKAKESQKFIAMLNDKKIKYAIKNKAFMDKEFLNKHQGYAAYRDDYKTYELEDFFKIKKCAKRLVILDGIQDPHNFGAILRSCDAFGIDGVILPKNRSVAITEVVAHVSTGAIEFVPICYVNSLTNTIRLLKENNFWIVGTDASGDASFADIDKKLNLAIIIGSEGFGMSKSILKDVDYLLSIPMIGHVNSLNASVSAGIVLHNLM